MKKLFALVFCFLFSSMLFAQPQPESELLTKARKFQQERNHEEAVKTYQQLVDKDSTNVEYVSNLSLSYSRAGAIMTTGAAQLSYYKKAKSYARQALRINNKYADAHLALALALARENENAPTKTKISNAKEIKKECDITIQLDPDNATAYHILGRWHRTFASMNGFEKTMVNTFYGGTPKGGTYADALENLRKAIKLEPSLSMHVYELAETYYMMGEKENAKKFLDKVIAYPVKCKDDEITNKKAKDLLAKMK